MFIEGVTRIDGQPINYLVSEENYELMKLAKDYDIDASYKLYLAFLNGEGTKPDFDLCLYYNLKVEVIAEQDHPDDHELKLATTWNRAVLYREFGYYEAMRLHFIETIDYMRTHFEIEDWDFELFPIIEDSLQLFQDN